MNERAAEIIEMLELEPLPGEGGFYRETYRSHEVIPPSALPSRYGAGQGRSHSTQIYFLLTAATPSRMHLVQSDEVFHHYLGDAVEQLHLTLEGRASVVRIGKDLAAGERPQVVVPRGVWQGCRLAGGSGAAGCALLGCTVSPGFEWEDFQLGGRTRMRALWKGTDARVAGLIEELSVPDQEAG